MLLETRRKRKQLGLLRRPVPSSLSLWGALTWNRYHISSCIYVLKVTKISAEGLKSDFRRVLQRFQRVQSANRKALNASSKETTIKLLLPRAQIIRQSPVCLTTHTNYEVMDDGCRTCRNQETVLLKQAIKLRLLTRRSDPPVADLLGINSEDDQPTVYMPHQTGAIQTQLNRGDHGDVSELGYVLQLEDQMQSIEANIVNVNIIIERLSALVYDQRTAVDSIEDNIQSALTNQEAGTTQLTRAANSRQRARKRCCICSIVLTTVLGVIVMILIIIYAPRSNN
ncbi:uncharacterized protein DEA37_0011774 [Paragonimus westermani]|uniref:t-SNARE coiled-coil homology domain-containing protein n=1 Tax=Paragonimus westermani TaxID=34504 RepID=A0A5J4NU81_9TREM|nr:uncharacterized protein DEA37_0011774 [Paragonimus westermani]